MFLWGINDVPDVVSCMYGLYSDALTLRPVSGVFMFGRLISVSAEARLPLVQLSYEGHLDVKESRVPMLIRGRSIGAVSRADTQRLFLRIAKHKFGAPTPELSRAWTILYGVEFSLRDLLAEELKERYGSTTVAHGKVPRPANAQSSNRQSSWQGGR